MTASILDPRASQVLTAPSAAGVFGRIWKALEKAGARRAAPQLLALANVHERRDPELAQRFREAAHGLMRG